MIAIAEDSADDEALLLRALRQILPDANVRVAHDGREARQLLADSDQPTPRLVITDLKMPGLDGNQLIRELRQQERYSHIPIVVFTSSDDPDDEKRCRDAGCDDFITKPLDWAQFQEKVSCLLNQYLRN